MQATYEDFVQYVKTQYTKNSDWKSTHNLEILADFEKSCVSQNMHNPTGLYDWLALAYA